MAAEDWQVEVGREDFLLTQEWQEVPEGYTVPSDDDIEVRTNEAGNTEARFRSDIEIHDPATEIIAPPVPEPEEPAPEVPTEPVGTEDAMADAHSAYAADPLNFWDAWNQLDETERVRLAQVSGIGTGALYAKPKMGFADLLDTVDDIQKPNVLYWMHQRILHPKVFGPKEEISRSVARGSEIRQPEVPKERVGTIMEDIPKESDLRRILAREIPGEDRVKAEYHMERWKEAYARAAGVEVEDIELKEDAVKLFGAAVSAGIPIVDTSPEGLEVPRSLTVVKFDLIHQPGKPGYYNYGSDFVLVAPDRRTWFDVERGTAELSQRPGSPEDVFATPKGTEEVGRTKKGRTKQTGIPMGGPKFARQFRKIQGEPPEELRDAWRTLKASIPAERKPVQLYEIAESPGVYVVRGADADYSVDVRPTVQEEMPSRPWEEMIEVQEDMVPAPVVRALGSVELTENVRYYQDPETQGYYVSTSWPVEGGWEQHVYAVDTNPTPTVGLDDPDVYRRLVAARGSVTRPRTPAERREEEQRGPMMPGVIEVSRDPGRVPRSVWAAIEAQEKPDPRTGLPVPTFNIPISGPPRADRPGVTVFRDWGLAREAEVAEVTGAPKVLPVISVRRKVGHKRVTAFVPTPEVDVTKDAIVYAGATSVKAYGPQGHVVDLGPSYVVDSAVGEPYVVDRRGVAYRQSELPGQQVPNVRLLGLKEMALDSIPRAIREGIVGQEALYIKESVGAPLGVTGESLATHKGPAAEVEVLDYLKSLGRAEINEICANCGREITDARMYAELGRRWKCDPRILASMGGDFLCNTCLDLFRGDKVGIVEIHMAPEGAGYRIRDLCSGLFWTDVNQRVRAFPSVKSAQNAAEQSGMVVKSYETLDSQGKRVWRRASYPIEEEPLRLMVKEEEEEFEKPDRIETFLSHGKRISVVRDIHKLVRGILFPEAKEGKFAQLTPAERKRANQFAREMAYLGQEYREDLQGDRVPVPLDEMSPEGLERVRVALSLREREAESRYKGDRGQREKLGKMTVVQMPARTQRRRKTVPETRMRR